MAFNICKDHVHMVIVCEHKDLNRIIAKFKGKSAYLYNTSFNKGVNPLAEQETGRYADGTRIHLWAQKFLRTQISETGYALDDAIFYVQTNRFKHGIPENKKLQTIIDSFLVSEEEAFHFADE